MENKNKHIYWLLIPKGPLSKQIDSKYIFKNIFAYRKLGAPHKILLELSKVGYKFKKYILL